MGDPISELLIVIISHLIKRNLSADRPYLHGLMGIQWRESGNELTRWRALALPARPARLAYLSCTRQGY